MARVMFARSLKRALASEVGGELGDERSRRRAEALVLERRRDQVEQVLEPCGPASPLTSQRVQLEPGGSPGELPQHPLELGLGPGSDLDADDRHQLALDLDRLCGDRAGRAGRSRSVSVGGGVALRVELERQRTALLQYLLGRRRQVPCGPAMRRPGRDWREATALRARRE
jgi:hypothetical protein